MVRYRGLGALGVWGQTSAAARAGRPTVCFGAIAGVLELAGEAGQGVCHGGNSETTLHTGG
jgi:hypothetical protein